MSCRTFAGVCRRGSTSEGLGDGEVAEIVLAVGEACNNAVEHAYAERPGDLLVKAVDDAGTLRITVEDRGMWRPETTSELRGRGITIMQTLMDAVTIESTAHGTRVLLERRVGRPVVSSPVSRR